MREADSTDKRVIKTKRNLRHTLLKMMDEEPFEKISVTELCRESMTSRITFYNYYQDKYDLLQDIYNEMQREMEEEFLKLQAENNKENSPRQAYRNFAVAVVDMYCKSAQFFRHMNPLESPEIMRSIYNFCVQHFSDFRMQYGGDTDSGYDADQLSAFLILGFWGFATYGKDRKIPKEKRKQDALKLFDDILDCGLAGIHC